LPALPLSRRCKGEMDLPLRELLPQNRHARRRRGIDAATAGSQSEGRAQGGAVVFDRRPDVADDGCPSHALSHALSPSHARVRARDSEPVMRPALKPGFEERKGLPPVGGEPALVLSLSADSRIGFATGGFAAAPVCSTSSSRERTPRSTASNAHDRPALLHPYPATREGS
jgi:hypothetical protein